MSSATPPPSDPFQTARSELARLHQQLQARPVDLMALAKAYAGLAQALHEGIQKVGQSSMRFAAVVKALDLRTTKSALQRFLDDA